MEKEVKLSFFKRLKMSMLDFDKYHIIASEGLGRAVLYLVKLMLLFALIVSLAYIGKIAQIMDEAVEYVQNEVPNFYFEDGSLQLESEKDVIIENHDYIDFKIIISNSEEYDTEELDEFEGYVVIALKDEIEIKQYGETALKTTYTDFAETYFSGDINSVDKEMLLSYVTGESAYTALANMFAVIFIIMFLTYLVTVALYAISLALLGYIVSRAIMLPLKFKAICSIGISALTLPTILELIYVVANIYTGFVMTYFQIMYMLIAYVALIAALLIMKSELNKRKIKVQIQIMDTDKMPEEKTEEKEDEKEKGELGKENINEK